MCIEIKKYNQMTKEERKAERDRRNENLKILLDNSELKKTIDNLKDKLKYYKKRDKVFITLVTNMKMIIEKYKNFEMKPAYYDMILKFVNQIDEEMRVINEKENIGL